MKEYDYYANKVLEQAAVDPDVNELNSNEVIEYSEEIAEMLSLDKRLLREHVREMEKTRTMTQF